MDDKNNPNSGKYSNQNLNQINDYYYELRYSQAAVLKMDLDRHWQILTNLQQAIKSVQTR